MDTNESRPDPGRPQYDCGLNPDIYSDIIIKVEAEIEKSQESPKLDVSGNQLQESKEFLDIGQNQSPDLGLDPTQILIHVTPGETEISPYAQQQETIKPSAEDSNLQQAQVKTENGEKSFQLLSQQAQIKTENDEKSFQLLPEDECKVMNIIEQGSKPLDALLQEENDKEVVTPAGPAETPSDPPDEKTLSDERYENPQHAEGLDLSDFVPDSEAESEELEMKETQGNFFQKSTCKKHACYFCGQLKAKMARHLEDMHSEEMEVGYVLAKDKKSKDRRQAWQTLINKGDFQHNHTAIEQKMGLVIPKYRKKEESIENYVSCCHCLGLYLKKELWKHQKSCRPSGENGNHVRCLGVHTGKVLLPTSSSPSMVGLFNIMKDDYITKEVRKDALLHKYGERLLDMYGDKEQLRTMVSQRLRELARFILSVKENNPTQPDLKSLIHPSKFELVLNGVKKVAGYEDKKQTYSIPSLAMKLGGSLRKCANIVLTDGIKEQKAAKDFLQLMENKFVTIPSKAKKTLFKKIFNAPQMVPLCEDVAKLTKHLSSEAEMLLEAPPNEETYVDLVKNCLAQVILFNRKRSGEAESLLLEDYQKAEKIAGAPDKTVLSSLSVFEQSLVKKLKRVETEGKGGRKVAILLTEDLKKGIDKVIKIREQLHIVSPYLFVRRLGGNFPYSGRDALRISVREISSELGAPHLLTSTTLTKHLATMSQVMKLSEDKQELLADFMGHSIRIHRDFYRLPLDIVQKAKIVKILTCINSGAVEKLQGQAFEDIPIDDEDVVQVDSDNEDQAEDDGEGTEESEPEAEDAEDVTFIGRIGMQKASGRKRKGTEMNFEAGGEKTKSQMKSSVPPKKKKVPTATLR